MSMTLSHPFRLDASGRPVVVAQGSARHAAEMAAHILACGPGERGLAPEWGLPDLSGTDADPDVVAATVVACEPDLTCTAATVDFDAAGHALIRADVAWSDTGEDD